MSEFKLIKDAVIINEGNSFTGSILINGEFIDEIYLSQMPLPSIPEDKIIDAKGKVLIPGVIDDQVHFREPGLTHKGDIESESAAAVAGGITSFMEMPNTIPQAITQKLLEEKYVIASKKSLANFSFYFGASNNNLDELLQTDTRTVCGIKIFMGASTGNMLVDNPDTLKEIFARSNALIAVHCEDEQIIRKNSRDFKTQFGEELPIKYHPLIRSEEACYSSSSFAVELAKKFNTRLHILHLSTARELDLFDSDKTLSEKLITCEACVHHLWFDNTDYGRLGTKIKWNPAIKTKQDKEKLFEGLLNNKIDVIATDHAPHTIEEKNNPYFKAPSGGPLVQHSLVAMLEFYHRGKLTLEKLVEKMCHAPAELFRIDRRGFIRKGYYADLVLIDLNKPFNVNSSNILYKCKWSPFEGYTFRSSVNKTFVNGNLVYDNGKVNKQKKGSRLLFNR